MSVKLSKPSIVLVEDDHKLAELLKSQLERFGYQVIPIIDFEQIDQEIKKINPALVLLDINLPYYDGFHWCRRIRQYSKVPILFISARAGEMDLVMALENGGDDYLTKPFHPEVLIAKIGAILRRTYGEYSEDHESSELEYNGLILDIERNLVRFEEQRVTLSVTERLLLTLLLQAKGRVVERDQLLTALWDDTQFVDDNTLTVNVARVRKKLAEIGLAESVLTVRGQGYRLAIKEN